PAAAITTNEGVRVAVTTVAASHVLDELNAFVIGVPQTRLALPENLVGLPEVGNAHAPDFEIVTSLETELLVMDASFREAHEDMLEELGIETFFFETDSFSNFQNSILELGELIDRSEEAEALVARLQSAAEAAKSDLPEELPTVAILFGAGEDLMLATPASYVGDLVNQLGVPNMAAQLEGAMFAPFLPISMEQLVAANPDAILRFAHASVENAQEMFDSMFENPALAALDAVQNDLVFDLNSDIFGVSANIRVEEAFSILGELFNGLQ
ncbi:MAG: ABC transporter substrate-binding protein, partial [Turicibacter sp.]|nr:ABC transporter substrate-binding protein [Turicibacter sp.]